MKIVRNTFFVTVSEYMHLYVPLRAGFLGYTYTYHVCFVRISIVTKQITLTYERTDIKSLFQK